MTIIITDQYGERDRDWVMVYTIMILVVIFVDDVVPFFSHYSYREMQKNVSVDSDVIGT